MGRTGRRPKPTAVKRLEGNPGKRPLPKNEPAGVGSAHDLAAPAHVDGLAHEEWQRLVATCGWLTATDRPALLAAAESYAEYQAALQHVREEGPVQTTGGGYQAVSGWYAVMNKERKHYLWCCQELGATPASRSRVELPEGGGEKDELEEWQSAN